MPQRPMKLCAHPMCGALVDGRESLCTEHKRSRTKERIALHGSAHSNGYDARWRKESRLFLRAHPMCACDECRGTKLPATIVDHIKPHKGDQALFWDPRNWQPMAKQCHDRKTVMHDGGFGNITRPYVRSDARGVGVHNPPRDDA